MKNNNFDKKQKSIYAVGLGIIAGMTFLIGFLLAGGFSLTALPVSFLLIGMGISLLPLYLANSKGCGGCRRK